MVHVKIKAIAKSNLLLRKMILFYLSILIAMLVDKYYKGAIVRHFFNCPTFVNLHIDYYYIIFLLCYLGMSCVRLRRV